jgi:hypothetical protein
MDKFCINHPEEKAVGTCGGCGALTCYRCSMNIDQLIYCSLDCFNQVNPPSTVQAPRISRPAIHDEFSDMMESFSAKPPASPPPLSKSSTPPASLEDPSVVLSAAQADKPSPTPSPARGNNVKLAPAAPSTATEPRPPLLSSSCYFHPDTSAVVRCAECRNPICSLCARETPAGPACSPSCGPTDLAGETQRRKELLYTLALGAASLLVIGGAVFLIGSWSKGIANAPSLSAAPRTPAPEKAPVPSTPKPEPEPPRPDPSTTAVVPAPAPVPAPPPVNLRPVYVPPPPVLEPEAPVTAAVPSVVRTPVKPLPEPTRVEARPEFRRPPEPPRLSPFESDQRWALALVTDATPLVREVLGELTPEWTPGPNLHGPLSKLQTAVVRLRQARDIYVRLLPQAPVPELVQRRITSINETLKLAQDGFERMGGVPQVYWPH